MGNSADTIRRFNEIRVPQGVVSVTPSNTANLAKPIRGFMVTAAGDVSVVMADGTSNIFPGCQPGTQYMGAITRINLTGTAATGIKGLL